MLGHNANLGHADFYPNGGKASMPGCNFQTDFVGACSHGRSYRYFAESIQVKNGFMSLECASWDDYKNKRCNGDPIPMGDAVPTFSNGTFYLETGSGPQYARYSKIFFSI